MKKHIIILFSVLIILLIYYSQHLDNKIIKELKIMKGRTAVSNINFDKHIFNIDSLIDSVSYLNLYGCPEKIGKIDRLEKSGSRIFLSSSARKRLYAFSNSGKFEYLIDRTIDGFQLRDNRLIVFERENNLLAFYTMDGKYMHQRKIGITSLECIALSDSTYLSYTAGIKTEGDDGGDYEFTMLDKNLNIAGRLLKIPTDNKEADYYPGTRFFINGPEIYFIPTFGTTLNHVNTRGISEILKIDFGNYSLSDADLGSIIAADNLYLFPYVFNTRLLAETITYRIFSFVFKGQYGYFLQSKKNNKNIAGLGSGTGINAGFNEIIPVGNIGDRFVVPIYNIIDKRKKAYGNMLLMLYHLRKAGI
ncbi:6-bladed beta-propeller [Pedobacter sp. UBA5917]|jgi:hypothetical protein|uniref:6-bladed beta-propeller n=1 Tax=Pedobacter sp. UBA5917 TaxID=1947061 RepID=UPI0025FD8BA1|nr:6-bladed beta-propeller [Pedobacter sp. UBA5917]